MNPTKEELIAENKKLHAAIRFQNKKLEAAQSLVDGLSASRDNYKKRIKALHKISNTRLDIIYSKRRELIEVKEKLISLSNKIIG